MLLTFVTDLGHEVLDVTKRIVNIVYDVIRWEGNFLKGAGWGRLIIIFFLSSLVEWWIISNYGKTFFLDLMLGVKITIAFFFLQFGQLFIILDKKYCK